MNNSSNNNYKVYIYAACDIFYSSYYILGLRNYFGRKNLYFNSSKFPNLSQNVLGIIVKSRINNVQKKIIIDFADSSQINVEELNWCDVYGKINLEENNNNFDNKIFSIGPSFAVRIWNLPQTIYYAFRNYFLSYKLLTNYKKFFSNYKQQYSRMPITAYTHQVSEKNYVFVLNSIWRKSHSTNINRLTFIEACKSCAGLNFEGGFAPRQNKDVKGFDAHTTERRYSIKEYISKTKRSAIVFNTPAVLDCHGWKLAEFLALGKAIITTPLSRALPAPLNDKKHFCEVNNLKDYHTIIDTLLNDFEFKEMLEKNARDYYEKYLKPSQTIAQLMSKFE